MRAGDFASAWRIADAVLAARDPAARDDPTLPYHLRWVWDGRPFDGRRVLVRCYHGLGDTLQFARFLPALRRRARAVEVECQPALVPLLTPLADRVIPFRPEAPAPPGECDLEIMELAHALRIGLPDLPGPLPHFPPPPRAALSGSGAAIGLCWQAGDWDRHRSVPLPLLADAVAGPGRRFVSLQSGPGAAAARAPGAPAFVNQDDGATDIAATMALIAGLDLVVTVDTMVAHLAGAMRARVALLLRHHADWRWMSGRSESPWYPGMVLYRQDSSEDWRVPLGKLAGDLRNMSAHRHVW
jgi:hypothetical protein